MLRTSSLLGRECATPCLTVTSARSNTRASSSPRTSVTCCPGESQSPFSAGSIAFVQAETMSTSSTAASGVSTASTSISSFADISSA